MMILLWVTSLVDFISFIDYFAVAVTMYDVVTHEAEIQHLGHAPSSGATYSLTDRGYRDIRRLWIVYRDFFCKTWIGTPLLGGLEYGNPQQSDARNYNTRTRSSVPGRLSRKCLFSY